MATKSVIRTLSHLRAQGFRCEIVEHFITFGPNDPRKRFMSGMRKDYMGIMDIHVLDKNKGIIGIQACGQDFASHLRKMTVEHRQDCIDWLETPCNFLELWGWRKLKLKPGGKAMRWTPRIQEITLKNLKEGPQ